jgi:translation elongation factor EF-4
MLYRRAGQVGFVMCNMRSTKEAHIGDTLGLKGHSVIALAGNFVPKLNTFNLKHTNS